eukprot:gene4796-5423_t
MAKKILVTGGAGYVGSHATVEMLNAGYECIVIDNLANAHTESLKRVEKITGKKLEFHKVNLLDKEELDKLFCKYDFYAVMHCAGLKAVGESCEQPLEYYHNNVTGTICLLQCMKQHKVYNMVFSSSATVYGKPQYLPYDEKHPVGIGITNPYGQTKFFIEQILKDLSLTDKSWNLILLRYFNPVGAHKSGLIGEDPQGIPNNLMPYISQVAVGRRPHLNIFGSDYETKDGTGVRDYIHVVDLAVGHVCALRKLEENCGFKLQVSLKTRSFSVNLVCQLRIYNLGSGCGYSVLEMLKAMEKACGKELAYKMVDRRAGDLPSVFADSSLALKELGWKTEKTLDEMCEDTWRWQENNPMGFLQKKE